MRCRPALKLTAISILLATVLCLFITYLRGGGELVSTHQSQLTNSTIFRKILSIAQSKPYHLLSTVYSSTSSSEANKPTAVLSQHIKVVKKANKTFILPTLTFQAIEDVETFMFFIGYPRSGHSIVASMIDAHPNAILAHEFSLFSKLAMRLSTGDEYLMNKFNLFNALYQDSYTDAIAGWRSGKSSYDKKGYSLKLNASDSWQGRFSTLKVIGDKSGGTTSRFYRDHPEQFKQMYHSLMDAVHVPIRVIHVVRNPFDMIATRLLYRLSSEKRQKAQFNSTYKLKDEHVVLQAFRGLYSEVMAVHDMIKACDLTVLEVHSEDFIRNPRMTMKSICEFIGLKCSESFLEMCEQVTYKHISRTRDAVEWSEEMKGLVKTRILWFPFFQRYSLTN